MKRNKNITKRSVVLFVMEDLNQMLKQKQKLKTIVILQENVEDLHIISVI